MESWCLGAKPRTLVAVGPEIQTQPSEVGRQFAFPEDSPLHHISRQGPEAGFHHTPSAGVLSPLPLRPLAPNPRCVQRGPACSRRARRQRGGGWRAPGTGASLTGVPPPPARPSSLPRPLTTSALGVVAVGTGPSLSTEGQSLCAHASSGGPWDTGLPGPGTTPAQSFS